MIFLGSKSAKPMTKSIKMSQDKFLGGKLAIRQIQGGYRAGSDPVLLAASLSLQPGQTLLDMGCGVGTAFLCALAREKSLRVTGIEIQKEISELAKRNSIENNFETEIYNLDIRDIKIAVGQKQFDHVIFNPPFFDINQGTTSKTTDRLLSKFALKSDLDVWLRLGMKRLKPGGEISLIMKASSLGAILSTMEEKVGSIKILPISSFKNVPCSRIIVTGKLGAKGDTSLLTPLIMHTKKNFEGKKSNFTKVAEGILYEGDPIDLGTV